MHPLDLRPGQPIGDYQLERELGRGAMGVVFLARHRRLGYPVAVKFLELHWARQPEVRERFEREGRAALTVKHPAVVEVHSFGTTDAGIPYLVMEHLEGLTLEQLTARTGALPPSQATAVLAPVLEALAAAHAAGVVHRDVKPANVMLTSGARNAVKLVDFGIAQVSSGPRLTRAGAILGTPHYMAPEQAHDAQRAEPASDLYAVGVMAFELLSGRLPFIGGNAAQQLVRTISEPAPPLLAVAGRLDSRLAALVDALLAKDPRARPGGAAEVRARLVELAPPDDEGLWALVNSDAELGGAPTAIRPSVKSRPRLEAIGPVPQQLDAVAPTALSTPHAGALAVERTSEAAPTTPASPVRRAGRPGRVVAAVVLTAGLVGAAALALRLARSEPGPPTPPPGPVAEVKPEPAPEPVPPPRLEPQPQPPPGPSPDEGRRNTAALKAAESALQKGQFDVAWKELARCQVAGAPCPEAARLDARIRAQFDRRLARVGQSTTARPRGSPGSEGSTGASLGDPQARARSLHALAVQATVNGQYGEARQLLQECLQIDPASEDCREQLDSVKLQSAGAGPTP